MPAIHLAQAVGGDLMKGFIAAVAFATILAVVSGLTLSGASAVSHDLYASVFRRGNVDEAAEVRVSRITTVVLGIVAVLLGIVFEKINVAFMVGLAFAVAASANFPVLLLSMLWKGLTTRGAFIGGFVGLISALVLTIVSPGIWEAVFGYPKGSRMVSLRVACAVHHPAFLLLLLGVLGHRQLEDGRGGKGGLRGPVRPVANRNWRGHCGRALIGRRGPRLLTTGARFRPGALFVGSGRRRRRRGGGSRGPGPGAGSRPRSTRRGWKKPGNPRRRCRYRPAGRVEGVEVPRRRGQRDGIAWSGRIAAANLRHHHLVVGAPHMGEGGLAEPLDEFYDALSGESAGAADRQMLRADADRQRVARLQGACGQGQRRDRRARCARRFALDALDRDGKKFIAGEPMNPATNRFAGS